MEENLNFGNFEIIKPIEQEVVFTDFIFSFFFHIITKTPLHFTAYHGKKGLILILLKYGADKILKNVRNGFV